MKGSDTNCLRGGWDLVYFLERTPKLGVWCGNVLSSHFPSRDQANVHLDSRAAVFLQSVLFSLKASVDQSDMNKSIFNAESNFSQRLSRKCWETPSFSLHNVGCYTRNQLFQFLETRVGKEDIAASHFHAGKMVQRFTLRISVNLTVVKNRTTPDLKAKPNHRGHFKGGEGEDHGVIILLTPGFSWGHATVLFDPC